MLTQVAFDSDFLSTALAVVSIATLAGLGLMRGTVISLRERVGDLTSENKNLKEGRVEELKEITDLKTSLTALTGVVTGEIHWVAIGEQIKEILRILESRESA